MERGGVVPAHQQLRPQARARTSLRPRGLAQTACLATLPHTTTSRMSGVASRLTTQHTSQAEDTSRQQAAWSTALSTLSLREEGCGRCVMPYEHSTAFIDGSTCVAGVMVMAPCLTVPCPIQSPHCVTPHTGLRAGRTDVWQRVLGRPGGVGIAHAGDTTGASTPAAKLMPPAIFFNAWTHQLPAQQFS